MSAKIEALKQHPGFPGALVAALEDLDNRLQVVEAHSPLLGRIKQQIEEYDLHEAELYDELPPVIQPTTTTAAPAADNTGA